MTIHESHQIGWRWYNIVGVPGCYTVKAGGNNRILCRDLATIEDARKWILN